MSTRRTIVSRRSFIKLGGIGTAFALSRPLVGDLLAIPTSNKVYSCYDAGMVSGTTVNYTIVKNAVDSCVMAMTGAANVDLAWRAVFPGITAASKIAIKINALNVNISPRFESVKALVESIRCLFNGTFPAANISLFDNNLWTGGKVAAAYGTANLNALGINYGEDTYAGSQAININGTTCYVSKKMHDAQYGISFTALKPHQYYAGYLSGTIKNMMGAVSVYNNATFKANESTSTGFHAPGQTPTLAAMQACNYKAFVDLFSNYYAAKLKLFFVDMLFGTRHENYTGWTTVVKRITMGTDPAAVDSYLVQALKDAGLNGYPTCNEVMKRMAAGVPGYSAAYALNSVTAVTQPQYGATAPTVSNVQQDIKAHKSNSKPESGVQTTIDNYVQEKAQ